MEILYCLLALLSGAGVFIFGINTLSSGLEKVSGPSMKNILAKLSNKNIVGVGLGALVTAIIHSSAATSVMVVGLVNANVLTLVQSATIIMGANIGTTITGLMISLSSLNINLYLSVFAFIGMMMMFSKKDKVKNIGSIVAGLGIIFIGLELMSNAFSSDSINNFFIDIFNVVDFPLLLILIGIVFTALLQSSTAMTGLIIIMVQAGSMPVASGLFIILGSNIGTCVSTILSTIGTNSNAKRAGLIHLLFNVIGTFIFTIILWIFKDGIVSFLGDIVPNLSLQIALFHFFFNVVTAFLLLPFTNLLVKVVTLLIKDKDLEHKISLIKNIDDRLLLTPSIAVYQVKKDILNMIDITKDNLEKSFDSILTNSLINKEYIYSKEDDIDYLNHYLTSYIVKLSNIVDNKDSKVVGSYFHVLNDIERIGDHAVNFIDLVSDLKNKQLKFSDDALYELKNVFIKITDMFNLSIKIFLNEDNKSLSIIDSYEEEIDNLKKELTTSHYERLSKNYCTIELGAYYISLVNGLERIGDHLVNVAYSIINPTGDQ